MGLVSNVVTWLLRMGVPVRIFGNLVVLLTVSGRKTGQPRTTLVDLYEREGRRFLVSTHGDDKAQWVHNLRATGKGTLKRGRRIRSLPPWSCLQRSPVARSRRSWGRAWPRHLVGTLFARQLR